MSSTARSFCVVLLAVVLIASFQPGPGAALAGRVTFQSFLGSDDHGDCMQTCKKSYVFFEKGKGIDELNLDDTQFAMWARRVVKKNDLPNSMIGTLIKEHAKNAKGGSITSICNKVFCKSMSS